MKNKGLAAFLAVVAVLLACLYGWVNNIIELVSGLDTMTTTEAVVRGVGVLFAPVGIIMGYV